MVLYDLVVPDEMGNGIKNGARDTLYEEQTRRSVL